MSDKKHRSEKACSEISRNGKANPFKFGSIVDEPYFNNRKDEMKGYLIMHNYKLRRHT